MQVGQAVQQPAAIQPEAAQRKVLTEAQVRSYHDNGYLVFENVLSPPELEQLRAASERLQGERMRIGGEIRLAVIHNVVLLDEAFMKAARHPFMLGVVTDLIGENLRLQHCKLNWKPPTRGAGEIAWHQDFPFFPHTNYALLACMFLLDDATPDNGCMRVIPGSHNRGPVNHANEAGRFTGRCTNAEDYAGDVARGTVVDFVLPAGSMTVHHCCTIHASYPNNSDTPRRGLVYQIGAGDAIQLGGHLQKCWNIWLQGADPLYARLVDGTVFRLARPLTNKGGLEPTADWRKVREDE